MLWQKCYGKLDERYDVTVPRHRSGVEEFGGESSLDGAQSQSQL